MNVQFDGIYLSVIEGGFPVHRALIASWNDYFPTTTGTSPIVLCNVCDVVLTYADEDFLLVTSPEVNVDL